VEGSYANSYMFSSTLASDFVITNYMLPHFIFHLLLSNGLNTEHYVLIFNALLFVTFQLVEYRIDILISHIDDEIQL